MKSQQPVLLRTPPHMVNRVSSGDYMLPQGISGDVRGSLAGIGNWIVAYPIVITTPVTIDAFSVFVNIGTGTLRMRLGVYKLDGANSFPGTLIQDFGEQGPGLSPPQVVTFPVSPAWSPDPGIYGMCITLNESSQVATTSHTTGSLVAFPPNDTTSLGAIYSIWVVRLYAALPSVFPSSGLFLVSTLGGYQTWPRVQ